MLLSSNKEKLLLNDTYPYRICGKIHCSMLLNYLLTKLEGHSDLDCRIVSKKDFQTSFLGQDF